MVRWHWQTPSPPRLNRAVLLIIMRRRLNGLAGRTLLVGTLKAVIAVGLMSATVIVWLNWGQGQSAWLVGLGGIGSGGIVYGLAMLSTGGG